LKAFTKPKRNLRIKVENNTINCDGDALGMEQIMPYVVDFSGMKYAITIMVS